MKQRLTQDFGGVYGYANSNYPSTSEREQRLLDVLGEIEDFEEAHNVDILSLIRCFDKVELIFEVEETPDEEMLQSILNDDMRHGTCTYYSGKICHVIGTAAQIDDMINEYELTDYSIKRR